MRLDPATIVPGHGEVLHGTDYVKLVGDFVAEVVARVDDQVHRLGSGAKLEDVQEAVSQDVDLASWRQRFAGDDPDSRDTFDGFSFPGLVKAAHADARRR